MSERIRPRGPRSFAMILPAALIALYAPIFVMVIASFSASPGGGSAISLHWYQQVFSDPVLAASLSRSLLVALGAAAIATVLGLIAALALEKWGFRARGSLRWLSSLSLLLPELVLALSLLSWFATWGLALSLWTVIIGHVTLTLPFVIMVIGARLGALDSQYDDAARDLGASDWQIFRRVTLPLLMPAVIAGFLLAFLISFDDFLVTFYTNGAGTDTLPVRLFSLMKLGMSPKVQALSTMLLFASVVLISIFFILFQGLFMASNRRPKT